MTRGFPVGEFQARLARAQDKLANRELAALLLTTEPEIRYFTGFLTRFWESPSRPWFLVVPAQGKPIAVIPSIGAALMAQTWVEDIRTWRAPNPTDDGASLLSDTLNEVAGNGQIGIPSGPETYVRVPQADWQRIKAATKGDIQSDGGITATLRAVKSSAEIEKIATACDIAGRAFARVPEIASEGISLAQVFRNFQGLLLDEGADWVPYLAGGAGPDGYADVISPATERPLADGDVLMLDTGAVFDGYFCDFDRNFAVRTASATARDAQARLIDAVDRAADIARPGTTALELFHAMDRVVTGGAGGSDSGRLGHGLGMQLTEGLSLIPNDHTELQPGMVITLEPGIETGPGRMMVHEENIVITEHGCRFLSPRAGAELEVMR
ncbi:intermediate cleaving peptidase 55 [Maritalea myrionectae]|uniref:Intermediate cleaving peptidase 55 n=1 Tax=Maritalea myrionectae TaxID=454601 RepID=A0A2R4MFC9_9HYPH|nr:Xaa-Pro peptidase family protein [Maritalea myrionectae]AVX04751.1 intermediate cleaving peptidase 55 [Maritalea myrionectae]